LDLTGILIIKIAVAYFAELNHHTGIKIAVIIDFKIMIQHQDWFFDSLPSVSFLPVLISPIRIIGFTRQFSYLSAIWRIFPRLFGV
jgi:hypothetical protein